MALKCKAHIKQTYQKAKATSVWPQYKDANILPVCDGNVTVLVRIDGGGGCHCCSSPEMVMEFACSKCKTPFVSPDVHSAYPETLINRLVQEGLEARQKNAL